MNAINTKPGNTITVEHDVTGIVSAAAFLFAAALLIEVLAIGGLISGLFSYLGFIFLIASVSTFLLALVKSALASQTGCTA